MVMETQGNESSGSGQESTGSESTGSSEGSESSSEVMPDDPRFAETGGEPPEESKPAVGAKPGGAVATPQGYSPNFKFKVLDQEKEFDDFLKGVVKDADTEKKVRELYEKAYGIEHVKSDRQRLREQTQFQQTEISRHVHTVNGVNQMLANKDYDNLLGSVLKIPEDDILRHAQKILQLREMPPEQRQAYDNAAQARQRVTELEYQNQQISQSHEQVAVSARTQELDWTLQRPDFSQLANAYDQRIGRQGAFREAVIERGKYAAYATGKDLSPEQAANEVLQFLGGSQALMPAQNHAQVVSQESTTQGFQERKPVITNIQGRGTSPAKKVVKSIADLRKRAKELDL